MHIAKFISSSFVYDKIIALFLTKNGEGMSHFSQNFQIIRDSFHIVRKISYSKLLTSSTFFRFLLYIHRLNYLFHLSFSHFGLFSLFELFSNISKSRKNLQFHAEKFIFISYHIFLHSWHSLNGPCNFST